MEFKIINGNKCAIKYYEIGEKKFWIGGQVDIDIPEHIRFLSKRPVQNSTDSLNHIVKNDIFFRDIDFLVNFFKSKDALDDNVIATAFLEICAKHITENERLIDNDMYLYVDETLLVAQNIFFSVFGTNLTNEMCKKAYPELVQHAINYLKKYIYITKYENRVDILKPYLVKFTDL